MFYRAIVAALCVFLAACSDPLEGLDRISDVDIKQDDPTAAALPTQEEIAREGYFGTDAAESTVNTPVVAPAAPAPARQGGLLGLLRGRIAPADVEAEAVAAAVAVSEADVAPDKAAPLTPSTEVAAAAVVTEVAKPAEPKGFFGRLLASPKDKVEDVAPPPTSTPIEAKDAPAQTPQEPVVQAALTPETQPASSPKRRGLFGRKAPAAKDKPRTGPDARDVDYDTVLPFGEVARSCVARGRPLGRKIEKAPARGFVLYDSKPGSDGPRTFYITGFADGCPRQLTAANVLLGSATLYEQLHYGPSGKHLPVGPTDKAYEKVKRRICGTGRGKPCGSKISKVEKSTFFVTAYSRFGNANTWSELLIHDGQVIAAAIKSNN